MKKLLFAFLLLVLGLPRPATAAEQNNPLDAWQPKFDPSSAQYTYILSNISHPVIEGVGVGYRIRDKVWEKSGGRLYIDYRALTQTGGEKAAIGRLKLGTVQGMLSSSVAAANIADIFNIVNLPYVVDTFDKLDTFRNTPELWEPFADGAVQQGLIVADVTGYGPYGWATTTPVRTLADAKETNIRIVEAPVNTDMYKDWGLKFTVMPWADVPQALQTGVISGLDHSAIVCNITKKFTIAKYFTELDYAQGLFIHLVNKSWLATLPQDLQEILLKVIAEESANTRSLTRLQHEAQIAHAKGEGVEFIRLSADEIQQLKAMAEPVLNEWGKKIGPEYLAKVREILGD